MTIEEVYQWAQRYHYPALTLGKGERISAGATGWYYYLTTLSEEGWYRLITTIERWEARVRTGGRGMSVGAQPERIRRKGERSA